MNCERATEMFMAGLAGELPGRDDPALEAHLQECAACRAETAHLAALWSGMSALPEARPSAALQTRFDRMLDDWQRAAYTGGRRTARSRLRDRFRAWAAPQPAAQWAGAVALLACGFVAGSWMAMRGGEMRALRQELQSTRSMMTLSLLQQRSPADRLQGIGYSMRDAVPEPQVITALFFALDHDPSIDVRLAAADAIGGLHPHANVGARLLESLRGQTSPLVQVAVLDVLAKRHESAAQELLRDMSTNPHLNKSVRERADWALRQLTL